MTINYPLHVQERFTRLLEQRAVQGKAKGERLAGSAKLEHAESGPLSPAWADLPQELPGPMVVYSRERSAPEERAMILFTLRELYVSSR